MYAFLPRTTYHALKRAGCRFDATETGADILAKLDQDAIALIIEQTQRCSKLINVLNEIGLRPYTGSKSILEPGLIKQVQEETPAESVQAILAQSHGPAESNIQERLMPVGTADGLVFLVEQNSNEFLSANLVKDTMSAYGLHLPAHEFAESDVFQAFQKFF